ncbi:hypothetical protein CISIN_1g037464mg, partial [Citrus sinensis]
WKVLIMLPQPVPATRLQEQHSPVVTHQRDILAHPFRTIITHILELTVHTHTASTAATTSMERARAGASTASTARAGGAST